MDAAVEEVVGAGQREHVLGGLLWREVGDFGPNAHFSTVLMVVAGPKVCS